MFLKLQKATSQSPSESEVYPRTEAIFARGACTRSWLYTSGAGGSWAAGASAERWPACAEDCGGGSTRGSSCIVKHCGAVRTTAVVLEEEGPRGALSRRVGVGAGSVRVGVGRYGGGAVCGEAAGGAVWVSS